MFQLYLQILQICTSLFAWVILAISGFCGFYSLKDPKARLLTIIILALWLVTSFNAWYEGFFLFQRIALLSVVNSWAFTFITPLFYLYYRFCITNVYPNCRKWMQHLFIPVLLVGVYISFCLFSGIPDRLVYDWEEFLYYGHSWWVLFRVGCYLFLVVQLSVYLPRLFGVRGVGGRQSEWVLCVRCEMIYIVGFCILSVIAMFTASLLARLLYNLAIVGLGVRFFLSMPYYRLLRQRLYSSLISPAVTKQSVEEAVSLLLQTQTEPQAKEEPFILFSPDEEKYLMERLASPELLHNPDLTIGMLARCLSTNETYLSRYFNRQLGISFPEYVNSSRLDEAEVLLVETNDSIVAISELVGFQTLSTFYQAFGARHQMPPSQWRKNRKK